MQSYLSNLHNNSNDNLHKWLSKNFKTKILENDDEKHKENSNKIITLKQLFDILCTNWGEKNIKVADHKEINGVIEFRILAPKKKLYYQMKIYIH